MIVKAITSNSKEVRPKIQYTGSFNDRFFKRYREQEINEKLNVLLGDCSISNRTLTDCFDDRYAFPLSQGLSYSIERVRLVYSVHSYEY